MELNELKTGDIFTIEDTLSYPKLKIVGGYVDIRDEIVNKSGNCDEREVSIINALDIQKAMSKLSPHLTSSTIQYWIDEAKQKYLPQSLLQ